MYFFPKDYILDKVHPLDGNVNITINAAIKI